MSSVIGEQKIALSFDKKSLEKSQKEVEAKSKSWGSKLAGVGATAAKAVMAGTTAAAAGITALVVKSTKEFANYEQLVGGVETLFKDSSSIVSDYANNAYKTAGLSANAYMETVTSFSASLLQGLGGDTAKAAEIANLAVTDMSDNANKMGTDMSRIQDAYQGFAKQNYTMLDNLKLGYGGTAGEMARLINDSGVLGDSIQVTAQTVNEVSFDKMIEAIHKVQDNLGITGTTAKEASDTISGSFNQLKGAWTNVLTGIADGNQDFNGLIANLVTSVGNVIKNLIPTITTAIRGVGKLVEELVPIIVDELPKLINELTPLAVEALADVVVGVVNAIPSFITILIEAIMDIIPKLIDGIVASIPAFINAIVQIANAITQRLPQLINQLVSGIMKIVTILTQPANIQAIVSAGFQLLVALVQAMPQITIAIAQALPAIILSIIDYFTDPATIGMIISSGVQLFMALVQAVPQILGALLGAFGSLFGALWERLQGIFTAFAGNFGESIGNVFKAAINGVIGFIEGFLNTPINAINGLIDVINNVPGIELGKLPSFSLPRLAQGGYATSATPAIFGEAGKEVALPLERNTDNWAGLLASTLVDELDEDGLGSRVTIDKMEFNVDNQLDARDIGRVVLQSMRRAA